MNFLEKYRPVFETADPPAPTSDPAAVNVDPPVTDPAQTQGVPVAVVGELRAKLRQSETERDALQRRAADAEALAERLAKANGNADPTPPAPAQRQTTQTDQSDVDRRAAEMNLQRDFRSISEAGVKTFGTGWDNAVRALDAYGVNSSDFVSDVMEIDREHTHEIMHALAQDGEKAVALAGMSRARRIKELTLMSAAKSEPKPDPKTEPAADPAKAVVPAAKGVSKAPAPAPRLEPSASKVVDWRDDKASDEEFSRGWDSNQDERSKRRAQR